MYTCVYVYFYSHFLNNFPNFSPLRYEADVSVNDLFFTLGELLSVTNQKDCVLEFRLQQVDIIPSCSHTMY